MENTILNYLKGLFTEKMPEFKQYNKIPRLYREVQITEKIDGSSGQILITDKGKVFAGSRNRWLTPGKQDNFGFAAWVKEHEEELLKLGVGRHYGEWYGKGIQRNYGLKEKRFCLFDQKWREILAISDGGEGVEFVENLICPKCCGVVPILYTGIFSEEVIDNILIKLDNGGSVAISGFMKPEGVVIYHKALNRLMKVTIDNDAAPKGGNNGDNR